MAQLSQAHPHSHVTGRKNYYTGLCVSFSLTGVTITVGGVPSAYIAFLFLLFYARQVWPGAFRSFPGWVYTHSLSDLLSARCQEDWKIDAGPKMNSWQQDAGHALGCLDSPYSSPAFCCHTPIKIHMGLPAGTAACFVWMI
eukprot:scaffold168505_cov21-Tisochrysis_lutea.AAC.1